MQEEEIDQQLEVYERIGHLMKPLAKYSIELKATSKGVYYCGSIKVRVDTATEMTKALDEAITEVKSRLTALNVVIQ